MLLIYLGRGDIAIGNHGNNEKYFLNINFLFTTYSPNTVAKDIEENHLSVTAIYQIGFIAGKAVDEIGGVHLHELCFGLLYSAEAGFLMKMTILLE